MRIISGKFKSRKIKFPIKSESRPTKDRIRESVFNIIADKLDDADVLDIFAGSGAYGFEALSRGAKKVVFVEKDRETGYILSENSRSLGVGESIKIIKIDAFKAIELLASSTEKFDIIFSDPPYDRDMAKKTLIMVNRYDILEHSGLLVVEHSKREALPKVEGDVSIFKQKTYGNIFISVFLRK
ncbi:MAG: 16S rRNA (guanine(966)-N(2))-methyltransferase RsmD [Candidatus Omnitrophota bacterium]